MKCGHYIEMKFLMCLLAVTLVSAQEWTLHWNDEFNGNSIDQTKWSHESSAWGGGNNEFQVYTKDPANSFVRDGVLIIKPTLLENNINPTTGQPYGQDFLYNGVLDLNALYGGCTAHNSQDCKKVGAGYGQLLNINPIASARLRSYGKFSFRYGKVEFRAKMPVGDWMWPAIWLLPDNWCYGDWPRSGEIDIVECATNENFRAADGSPLGIQRMGSTLPWGMRWDDNRFYLSSLPRINETSDYGNNFHIYVMEWTPNGLSFLIDDFRLLDVPYPLINQNSGWKGFFEWGKPWTSINENDPYQNPWRVANDPLMVPFDTKFHFLLNVAVGGTNYFREDGINRGGDPYFAKPWKNTMGHNEAMTKFYEGKDRWQWTWGKEAANNDNDGMHIDYVRVYKRADLPAEQVNDCKN